jgi:ectoine hydroxylase-related dioxygenase (phytanoyl-CoA dioxygenase family)
MTLTTGEVSFHSGWTFHQAAGNGTDAPREVFTIIFMDKDMIMAEPINHNQRLDHDRSVNLRLNLSLNALNPVRC